ncbi:MAG: GNAT family N-acetyltransferase [Microgenomates group bacterium]
MIAAIAKLHIRALPHTLSSRMGVLFVAALYGVVYIIGQIEVVKKNGEIVGAMARIGRLIVTLVVDPERQRKGIGRELIDRTKGRQYVYTETCTCEFYKKMGFEEMFRLGKIIFLCRK